MSEKGLEPLINDCLKNGDYFMRRVAVDALGRTGRLSVLPYLVISIDDSDKYTRWHAAKGLGRFVGSSEARDALIRGLADKDPYVRRRSARSLEKFGGIGPSEDIETEEEQIDDGLSSDVAGPLEENDEGDIDGDGIPDSEDKKPRKKDKKKGKNKEDDLARIAEKKESIDFKTLGTASEEDSDDLKNIKGIGPFLEQKLNALGIYTYEQISNMTPELEDQVNEAIEFFPGRIKRDNWVKQAKDLK
jgi:predicted flap endonuclease-1-like 5' DNA nuclease